MKRLIWFTLIIVFLISGCYLVFNEKTDSTSITVTIGKNATNATFQQKIEALKQEVFRSSDYSEGDKVALLALIDSASANNTIEFFDEYCKDLENFHFNEEASAILGDICTEVKSVSYRISTLINFLGSYFPDLIQDLSTLNASWIIPEVYSSPVWGEAEFWCDYYPYPPYCWK
ncbi:MAG: hypothetical protein GXO57_05810 [Thermodesulfobacteria bacterium]|nr:hypothetical protein [Thermodesulfobacteriota bacterium]